MRWVEFAHAVRAAAAVLGEPEVVVLGSQAILGSVPEGELPAEATVSREIDIAATVDDDDRKSHLLAGSLGEESPFDRMFGFHVDGVGLTTAVAPRGWLERLVRVSTPAMAGATALCMEPHDLCVAKLVAGRDKDVAFVAALLDRGIVDRSLLLSRIEDTEVDPSARAALRERVAGMDAHSTREG